ncbi:DHH family phosphoesterase [Anoxybacillus flavithermus]|uniref:DHH family phosphoesterase n=1 Tax=Anoxybacillus flavithermus TaxID=33934 RepID=UPI0007DA2422|nr:DHH family phosphoesterase [Anoxybacillus flavithermus]
MRYKLIGVNDYLINPIQTILNNRGIKDIEKFLNLDESVVNDWSLLKNIHRAVECLLTHIEANGNIFVQVDSDADGYTSSAILINYLKSIFPNINIKWELQEGKEHGIILDKVPSETNLVIVPDSGSNQYEIHSALKKRGIDVIVLDHHECEKESEDAIVVNNQLSPEYPNKNFSGAGIVYKFCKAIDEYLGINKADYFLDLVAVGNIADMMDMRELETRYYVLKGLESINNSFIKALLKQQEYSINGVVNITNIAFYIVPLINAAIRVGDEEDKINMMKSFLESNETVYYKKKDIDEPIQTATARRLYNLKNKQNRLRDKGVELIEKRIEEKRLLLNKVLIVNVTDILDKNLTGLVANQISRKYKRPVLLIRQKEKSTIFGGSARGYEKGVLKDFKQFLQDINQFIFCEGHKNAFGFEIEAEKLIEVNDIINDLLKDVEIDVDEYEVDFIIPSEQFDTQVIYNIHKLKDLWSNNVEEPLIAITKISVNKEDIQLIGKNKNTLKFKNRNIDFIKFNYSEEEFKKVFNGECFVMEVVGRCSINQWDGKEIPQFIIEDFNILEIKDKEWIF